MIFLNLSGGLGNQFFQYAYGRYLQIQNNQAVTILLNSYQQDSLRDPNLSYFKIDNTWKIEKINYLSEHPFLKFSYRIIERFTRKKSNLMRENSIPNWYKRKELFYYNIGLLVHNKNCYLNYPRLKNRNYYVEGMWHTDVFLKTIKDHLKKELVLREDIPIPPIINEIRTLESVCVHIRRGDYLNYPYYMTCSVDYYIRCFNEMKKIHPNAVFFIFSDDIAWAKENIKEEAHFIEDDNPDYIDMELMRNCKHFIISNSTFSWWAAYLGQAENKTVITPDKWYTDGRNKEWLNLDDWIVMKTNV